MKTYAFNLLPQKSRSLVKKEEKRDNYALLITIFPLLGVILWLSMVLIDKMVIDYYDAIWKNTISDKKSHIEQQLMPVLIQHGELVQKTNSLSNVVTKDVKPEQLFVLLDKIYSNQDSTFTISGYGRNPDGSFSVNIIAMNYLRLSEIARRFSTYKYINDVRIKSASYNEKGNNVNGVITFFFNYEQDSSALVTN